MNILESRLLANRKIREILKKYEDEEVAEMEKY